MMLMVLSLTLIAQLAAPRPSEVHISRGACIGLCQQMNPGESPGQLCSDLPVGDRCYKRLCECVKLCVPSTDCEPYEWPIPKEAHGAAKRSLMIWLPLGAMALLAAIVMLLRRKRTK